MSNFLNLSGSLSLHFLECKAAWRCLPQRIVVRIKCSVVT